MQFNVILKEVLSDIVPSKDERFKVLFKVNEFLSSLNKELKRVNVKAVAVLGGSYSKDTWLSGDYDVDVFVKFDLRHREQNLSDLLESALRPWRHERIHGSRDYFWVRNGVKYEIVPVLDIAKAQQAENVTDFSPWHVKWVNQKGAKFKNDIRLAKKFCKGCGCYGAESYIRGFSGHVLDILTIYYKGFIPLLRAVSKWSPKVIIDCNKVYKGNALLMMNKSKTEGPLLLVDPVQPGRNSAAALTLENFDKLVKASKSFLKKPFVGAFVEKEIDFIKLSKKGYLVKIDVNTLDDKEDVAGTKFVRAFEHVRDSLADFVVKDSGWTWDRKSAGVWWFVLAKKVLPNEYAWAGPPVKMADAVKNFKKAYKKTFVKSGRIWAMVKRDACSVELVLRPVLAGEYVKSRVRSVKL